MLAALEKRLDNVTYRMGLATSRAQGRQSVRHGHIAVNGKKVNIPSFTVKPGDVVEIREGSKKIPVFWPPVMPPPILPVLRGWK